MVKWSQNDTRYHIHRTFSWGKDSHFHLAPKNNDSPTNLLPSVLHDIGLLDIIVNEKLQYPKQTSYPHATVFVFAISIHTTQLIRCLGTLFCLENWKIQTYPVSSGMCVRLNTISWVVWANKQIVPFLFSGVYSELVQWVKM